MHAAERSSKVQQ